MNLLAVFMCVLAVCCGVLGAPQRPPYQPDPWVYPKPTSEPPLPVTPSWAQRPMNKPISNVTPPRLGTSQRPRPVAASLTTAAGSTKKPPAAEAPTTAASISVSSSTQSASATTPAAAEAPQPTVTQEMPQPEAAATQKAPSRDF